MVQLRRWQRLVYSTTSARCKPRLFTLSYNERLSCLFVQYVFFSYFVLTAVLEVLDGVLPALNVNNIPEQVTIGH